MICDSIKPLLPLLATGDLTGEEVEQVHRHCDHCPACTAELKTLHAVLQTLTDASPTSQVQVEVADIYRAEATRQTRATRRWRWSALSLAAAAALLLGLFGLARLEFHLNGQQLVVRWGALSNEKSPAAVVVSQQPAVTPAEDAATRLARLEELVLALAGNDRGQDSQLSRHQRLTDDALRQLAAQLDDLRHETRQDRAGIYAILNANTSSTKE
jgi:hypothetical protein